MSRIMERKIELLNRKIDVLQEENRLMYENLQNMHTLMLAALPLQILTVADLAQRWGISTETLYAKNWLLPRYGVSDFEDCGAKRWRLPTVMEWEKTSPRQHEVDWNDLGVAGRKAILKKSKKEGKKIKQKNS